MGAHADILILPGIAIAAVAVFRASLMRFRRRRSASAAVQLAGASGLVVVVLAHLAETFRWLAAMGWGRPDSVGHYLDLAGAVIGVTLLPIGYVAGVLAKRTVSRPSPERPARRD